MQISNRAKLIIASILALIAVLLILFWPGRGQKPATTPTANQTNTQVNANSQLEKPVVPAVPLTSEEKQAATAQTVAKIFVERFGSYSSQSEAQNLQDILPLTTGSYGAKLEAQIVSLKAKEAGTDYYGVSTRFISLTVVRMEAEAATFDIVTQREEATGSPSNTSVKYQTVTVTLKLDGQNWLVDSATWK